MLRKLIVILCSSLVAIFLAALIDQVGCDIRGGCVEDDASVRASALQLPMAVLYALLSWVSVYPSVIYLSRYVARPIAALLAAAAFSVGVSLLLHKSAVDESFLHTLSALGPWLGLPWFVSGLVVAFLWPHSSDQPLRARAPQ